MKKKSFLYKVNLFIRSFIFSVIMLSTMIIQSFISVLTFPLPLRIRYQLIINYLNFTIWTLKKICHINYVIEGLENVPKNRNGVILCKHQSTWETFILPGIFSGPAIILKRELLWVPFFGWGAATVNPIAINRNEKSSAMEQILVKGKECLDAGRWVLVFPEGTRIPVGKIGKYRLGGARLAVSAGYPIIPIAHNAGRYWPRRQFIKKPGTVRMVIGPLIETTNRSAEEVLEEAKNWIENTVARIDKVVKL